MGQGTKASRGPYGIPPIKFLRARHKQARVGCVRHASTGMRADDEMMSKPELARHEKTGLRGVRCNLYPEERFQGAIDPTVAQDLSDRHRF